MAQMRRADPGEAIPATFRLASMRKSGAFGGVQVGERRT